MSLRTTLALLAILVALCIGYALMVHFEEQGREARVEAKKLFGFQPEDVVAVEVQRIDEAPAAASRTKGAPWAITKPNNTIEANQVVWDRLAMALAGLMNERTIDPAPSDPAAYGLDKPVLTMAAATDGGKQVHLTFGAVEPTQSYRYTRGEGDAVFLVSVKAFREMDRPLDVLRNPYIVAVGKQGITRLEFARYWTGKEKKGEVAQGFSPAGTRAAGDESVVVAVEKSADGAWRMVSPIEALANQEAVEALVKHVQYATGHNYVETPQHLEDYGLEPPRARITVYGGVGSEPQTILLGSLQAGDEKKGQTGGLFAKRKERPAVFVIDPQIAELLPKTPDSLRESRLFSRQAKDIRRIHYIAGQTDLTFDNDQQHGWTLAGPETQDTDQQAVSNFIVLLKALQGRGFPGDAKPEFALDNPRIALTFTFKDSTPPANIRVGAKTPDADQYYATMDNGVVTLLNEIDVKALSKTPFDFRRKGLLTFAKAEVIRVELQFEGAHYVFEKPRGQWRIKEPANLMFGSGNDIDALLETLSGMRALAVEAEAAPVDLAPYGLDAPVASVTVTIRKPTDPAAETVVGTARIGKTTAENSQQRFAVSTALPGVYRAKQAIIDDIRGVLEAIH
jgi:hypothetical protein